VAVSFFGDGASNEGAFHEGLNAAAIYDLSTVFVCENNLYGASTSIKRVMKLKDIADRAAAYGMRGDIGDGMNVFEVYEKAKKAVTLAREGNGPTLLELKTFRLCGHSRRDPNNYMTTEEKEYWKERDPIPACEKMLKEVGYLNGELINQINGRVEEKVDKAIEFGQTSPDPKPEDTYEGLYIHIEVPK
jgi:pyruvate dehydrogenase E1 component alpha subunit